MECVGSHTKQPTHVKNIWTRQRWDGAIQFFICSSSVPQCATSQLWGLPNNKLHLEGESLTQIQNKCIGGEAEAACWDTDTSVFLSGYKKLQMTTRAWWRQQRTTYCRPDTHTQNGFNGMLWLIRLDSEERGCPMGLPHGWLHVMWPQRRRCDSAG